MNTEIEFETEEKAKRFYKAMKGLKSKYSTISYYIDGKTVGRY